MHNGIDTVVKGVPSDISKTGIFVRTDDINFSLGEEVRLTVKIPDVIESFTIDCQVTRCNDDARFSKGFGLRFKAEPQQVLRLFERENLRIWGEQFVLEPSLRDKKLLLVDGNKFFRNDFARYSNQNGISVTAVEDMAVFQDLNALKNYDVILVAYELEPFSGLEVAEILNKHMPDLPIVMLTEMRNPWEQGNDHTPNVLGFANKWDGMRSILSKTLKIFQ
jgi:CheY-like chemotaxis protein